MLKYALRQLAKSPGFAFVAVVMLALGIGMSTSTFSLTNRVLLSALPFPQEKQLVRIFSTSAESQTMELAPGTFLDVRAAATSYSAMAAFVPGAPNVAEPGQPPEQQFGLSVTANFLTTLGVQPALGRGFSADEDQPGKGAVMILTDSYWRRKFAADPGVIGKTLRVGVEQLTVIGVLPPSFDRTMIWYSCGFLKPQTIWRAAFADQRTGKWFSMLGRLKPGVRAEAAQAELAAIAARLVHDHPADYRSDGLRAERLASSFVDLSARKLYWLAVALAGLVLVIACANLASVQLARAFGRSHEFAVRAALGASRVDLMGPLLVESALLTLAGGALGLLVAFWANRLISHHFWGNITIPIDGRVVLFAAAACLVTALTFGLAPAWLASRVSTGDALKDSSRGSTSSRTQRRLKFALVVGQLAIALVLVSAAVSFGVGVRSFLHRDVGWRPEGLISGDLNVPYEPYQAEGKKVALMRTLQEKLGQIPGVSRVSLASGVPLYGSPGWANLIIEGAAPMPVGQEPSAFVSEVDGGFRTTLGIPLKAGRFLPEVFKVGDPPWIVINETMARRFWPGQSALGRRVKFTDEPQWNEVIGVVGDISLATDFQTPPSQLQIYRGLQTVSTIWYNFVLKSALPPEALVGPIRRAIRDIDPDLVVEQLGGWTQLMEGVLSGNDLLIVTLGALAGIGLLIALIGLYGVISQLTQQRSREIGIRMALGADAAAVVRLILGQGGRLILAGIAAGLAGAYAVGVFYRQTMPELPRPGLAMQVGLTLLLGAAGLAACYWPARRASRTNPVEALRAE